MCDYGQGDVLATQGKAVVAPQIPKGKDKHSYKPKHKKARKHAGLTAKLIEVTKKIKFSDEVRVYLVADSWEETELVSLMPLVLWTEIAQEMSETINARVIDITDFVVREHLSAIVPLFVLETMAE